MTGTGVISIGESSKIDCLQICRLQLCCSSANSWWKAENGRDASLNAKTIKIFHEKLFETGTFRDKSRSENLSTSNDKDIVNNVQNMFQ